MTERSVFLDALDVSDPVARAAFLNEVCAADPALRLRVEELLVTHFASASFMAQPEPERDQPDTATKTEASVPDRPLAWDGVTMLAGRYQLLEPVGEGGMGTVYRAEQVQPVKRTVAVKLIKPGMDSRAVLTRFEAERQALALMDHPHIAKVLDAGVTPDGRPFFVMEFVTGVPLTDYCDAHRLSMSDRLDLFRQLCGAVQHAHQKGVIHRDLKPSNVLVEHRDGKPVPKVIDFGLAKAVSATVLSEHSLHTGFGTVLGTPMYMAPEQASFHATDVDTRADVYALGVILYELLTGTTPLTRDTIKKAVFEEMLRLVREQESPVPSSRISTAEGTPSAAANRQMEPAKLGRFVRGELDWIVLKALNKDRDRRYATAAGFANDIARFLNHEPVTAGPVGAGYKLKKFVQRNTGPVIAGSLILFTLLVGTIGTSLGLLEAVRQKAEADRQTDLARTESIAKEQARAAEATQRAKAEQAEADTLADYRASTDDAVEQLIGSKPDLGPKEKTYLENTLKRWQAFANRQGDDERSRSIRGEGHRRVGYLWLKLGRNDEARAEYQSALAIWEKLATDFPAVPMYHQGLAATQTNLGLLLTGLGQRSEAEAQYRSALALREKLIADFPAEPAYRQELGASHNNLGLLLKDLGQRQEGEEQYRKAVAIREKLAADFPAVPAYQVDLGGSYCNYGNSIRAGGNPAESLKWFGRAIECLQAVHEKEPRDVTAHQFLRNSHSGRAEAHVRLQAFAVAVKDWDRAITLSPPAEQPRYRASRADSQQHAGMVAEAVAEVAELTKTPNWTADQWYDFAYVYAVASQSGGINPPARLEYAERAMEMLAKAVKAGYKDAIHMKMNTDLDPLLDRDDFNKLLAELEQKFPSPKKPDPPQPSKKE